MTSKENTIFLNIICHLDAKLLLCRLHIFHDIKISGSHKKQQKNFIKCSPAACKQIDVMSFKNTIK